VWYTSPPALADIGVRQGWHVLIS